MVWPTLVTEKEKGAGVYLSGTRQPDPAHLGLRAALLGHLEHELLEQLHRALVHDGQRRALQLAAEVDVQVVQHLLGGAERVAAQERVADVAHGATSAARAPGARRDFRPGPRGRARRCRDKEAASRPPPADPGPGPRRPAAPRSPFGPAQGATAAAGGQRAPRVCDSGATKSPGNPMPRSRKAADADRGNGGPQGPSAGGGEGPPPEGASWRLGPRARKGPAPEPRPWAPRPPSGSRAAELGATSTRERNLGLVRAPQPRKARPELPLLSLRGVQSLHM